MADEITMSVRISAAKANYKMPTLGGSTQKIDMAGDIGGAPGVVSLTTSAAKIDFGPLSTIGVCYLENVSASGNAIIGNWDGSALTDLLEIRPGERFPVRFLSTLVDNIGGKSSAGTVDLLLWGNEA